MLTRFTFNHIFSTLAAALNSDEERTKFLALPIPAQMAAVEAAIFEEDITADAKTAALFIEALGAITKPGTVNNGPIVWHKANPPKKYPELIVKWPEEYAKLGAIAAKLGFGDVGDYAAYTQMAHEVLLGVDYLGYVTSTPIPPSDPTMQLFLEGIDTIIRVSRPEWFDAVSGQQYINALQLPAGSTTKSVEEVDDDEAREHRKRRRDIAARSASRRKEARLAELKKERAVFDTEFQNHAQENPDSPLLAVVSSLATRLSALEFTAAKTIAFSPKLGSSPFGETWLPGEVLGAFGARINSASTLKFAEDVVLSLVHIDHPDWFMIVDTGSTHFRRCPLKSKDRGMDRPTRALHNHLSKYIAKHGAAKVREALDILAPLGKGNTPDA